MGGLRKHLSLESEGISKFVAQVVAMQVKLSLLILHRS